MVKDTIVKGFITQDVLCNLTVSMIRSMHILHNSSNLTQWRSKDKLYMRIVKNLIRYVLFILRTNQDCKLSFIKSIKKCIEIRF